MSNWKNGGNWTASLLNWTAFSNMYKDGRDCNPMFFEYHNGITTYYQTQEAINSLKLNIIKKIKNNPKFVCQKLKTIERELKEHPIELNIINLKLQKNNPNLLELFKKYWKLYDCVIFGMAIDIYFDDILCEELKKYLELQLKKIKKQNEFDKYYIILTSTQEITTTQKEEIEFLKILLQNEKSHKKLFENHLKKFSFLPMWFDNNQWNINDLQKRSKIYKNKKQIYKQLTELKNNTINLKKSFKKTLIELKPDKKILKLIEQIQKFAFLRQQGEVQIGYHTFSGIKLKKLISNRLKININDLKFLTADEIIENLKNKDKNLKQIINQRKKYSFLIMKNGKCTILTGNNAKKYTQKIKNQIQKEKIYKNKTLTGIIGSMGYAKGKVRILHKLSDIEKIKHGEIMVVSGTSLEYLSAMQKASAIIAEIGGITSHAAVTCREMRKPCLTRVPNATKILHDRDLIEVDANNGIIRIIK